MSMRSAGRRSAASQVWLGGVVALTMAASAAAHDTWLLPRRAAVSPGAAVTLDLTSGMAFPAPETAIQPERIARSGVRLAGINLPLRDRRSAQRSLVLTARLPAAGLATLWIELAAKSLELDEGEVAEYLDEIGAGPELRKVWAAAGPGRRWRETYVKHAKTFVRVGDAARDRSWAEPVGMKLEIVPEKDPTALRPGEELPLRVLRDGNPCPGLAVGLVREGDAHAEIRRADAAGRLSFRVPRSGRWLLRATDLRPSGTSDAHWESDFTTLTFSVP